MAGWQHKCGPTKYLLMYSCAHLLLHVSHSRALLRRCAHPLLAPYPHPSWLPICLLPPSAYFLPPAYVLAHLPSLEIVNLSAYLPT